MVPQAKRRANNRWDSRNMAILSCKVRRDYAERVKACCEARGDAVNAILRAALDQYLGQYEEREEE